MVENSETNEICCTEDIKPGKLLPDKYLELESIDSSPAFYIKMEETKDVKEIVDNYKNNKKDSYIIMPSAADGDDGENLHNCIDIQRINKK